MGKEEGRGKRVGGEGREKGVGNESRIKGRR